MVDIHIYCVDGTCCMMPMKTLICKLVLLLIMLYNIFVSPLWTKWSHLDNDLYSAPDALTRSSPWWGDDIANHARPELYILNITQHSQIDKSTIHQCINTSTSQSFPICVYPEYMDKYISAALLSEGIWEPYITPLFEKALIYYKNATVIDIGANIGYYTLLAAEMGHATIAVEPSCENLRHLQMATQTERTSLRQRITVLNNAVSNTRQHVTLTTNANNQGGLWIEPIKHDVRTRDSSFDSLNSAQHVISTILLDDLRPLLGTAPRTVIIKVDIEGFECQAIDSGKQLLIDYNIPYIFMEWGKMFKTRHRTNSPCPMWTIRRIVDLLTRLGYIAVEVRTGFVLDPERSTTKWKIGDLYWRHNMAPELQNRY